MCQSNNRCNLDATGINFHGGHLCCCNDDNHGNGRTCYDEKQELIVLVAI